MKKRIVNINLNECDAKFLPEDEGDSLKLAAFFLVRGIVCGRVEMINLIRVCIFNIWMILTSFYRRAAKRSSIKLKLFVLRIRIKFTWNNWKDACWVNTVWSTKIWPALNAISDLTALWTNPMLLCATTLQIPNNVDFCLFVACIIYCSNKKK